MSDTTDDEGSRSRKRGDRNPPTAGRFQKGQSGNPRGRPKGSNRQAPYESLLSKKVLVRENGAARWLTASEAFLLQLAKRGIEGGGPAARTMMDAIEKAKDNRATTEPLLLTVEWLGEAPGSVNAALEPLHMARIHDAYRDTARTLLEPWLVEAALARLGERRYSAADQRSIVEATRTPHKVRWPTWWTELP